MKQILFATLCATALLAFHPQCGKAADLRDGTHDFDFNFGTWHTHIKRLTKPLSGSVDFVELDGTVTVSKIWDGKGQIEDFEVDGPKGHVQGMTIFLYNAAAHQWSQTWASAMEGALTPALVGGFKDGRGELIAQDTLDGRTILVRGVWSEIKPDSHRFEEDYSEDGGKSWEVVFDAHLNRVKP